MGYLGGDLNSHEFFSINADSQIVSDDLTYVPTNESLIERNIVIVIDSSGSTLNEDPTTHLSIVGPIHANAINILRGLGHCNYAGVVVFGGETRATDMMPMSNDTYKAQLEKFIRDDSPAIGEDNPTDINAGLRSAQKLLGSLNGTKEIIVISDGFIPPSGISQTKNTVIDLKLKDIKIQFIQVIDYNNARLPNDNYELLAKAAGTNVILLYPDERVRIMNPSGNASNANEPCILPTPTITSSPIITINETSIPSSSSTLINQNVNTRTEAIKTPGFEGVLTILAFLIHIKLRYKI